MSVVPVTWEYYLRSVWATEQDPIKNNTKNKVIQKEKKIHESIEEKVGEGE
jgi:hypothetical protein